MEVEDIDRDLAKKEEVMIVTAIVIHLFIVTVIVFLHAGAVLEIYSKNLIFFKMKFNIVCLQYLVPHVMD